MPAEGDTAMKGQPCFFSQSALLIQGIFVHFFYISTSSIYNQQSNTAN